jgi:hypothetical protein
VLHGIARLDLDVVNSTDTTFTGVRVEARLPAELWGTAWQGAVRRDAEPPERPTPYGQGRVLAPGLSRYHSFSSALLAPGAISGAAWRPSVDRGSDAVYLEYVPEDVRAQGVTPLPPIWVAIDDPATEMVTVEWEATATNTERRLTGTITVPVQQPPARISDPMANPPEDED